MYEDEDLEKRPLDKENEDDQDEIEVEFEDEEVSDKEDQEDSEDSEDTDDQDESDDDDEEPDKQRKAKKGGRAERRIRGLVSTVKRKEEEKAALAAEKAELERQLRALQGKSTETENMAFEQIEQALNAQEASLAAEFSKAFEEQDSKKIYEVQSEIGKLQAKRALYDAQKVRRTKQFESSKEHDADNNQQLQQQQFVDRRSERTKEWMDENDWFFPAVEVGPGQWINNPNFDVKMHKIAMKIHEELENEGISESNDPDEYFSELNARIKDVFPDKFKGAKPKTKATVGSGRPTGANSNNKKKIKLTAEEKEFCIRNGIDPKKYALEKSRLDS